MNQSWRTAITRPKGKLSAPMAWLKDIGYLDDPLDVLDFGCGKGQDADLIGMDKYDSYYFPARPNKKYSIVTCIYVLNVLEPYYERPMLVGIKRLLQEQGFGFIAVRRDINHLGYTSRHTYQRKVVLPLRSLVATRDFEIYWMGKE